MANIKNISMSLFVKNERGDYNWRKDKKNLGANEIFREILEKDERERARTMNLKEKVQRMQYNVHIYCYILQ